LVALAKPDYRNRFDAKGNYVYPNLGSALEIKTIKRTEYKFNNPYLEKIQLLCEGNGIELILYQSPLLNQQQISPKAYTMINHSTLLARDTAFFYDAIHVNKRGRIIATQSFVNAVLK
jgi:hypothetical protein